MTEHGGAADAERELEQSTERAVRLAARAGNRLLAGGRAEVRIDDPVRAAAITGVLTRMGVRVGAGSGAGRPDFVFAARDGARVADAIRAFARTDSAVTGLPVTVIPVPLGPSTSDIEGDLDLTGTVHATLGADWRAEPLRRDILAFHGPEGSAAVALRTGLEPEADAEARIAWAALGMPVTAALAAELAERRSVAGTRVAVSLVLEPKTSALALALQRAGAEVAVFSAVSETDPSVARALAAGGVRVFAPQTQVAAHEAAAVDAEHAAGVLDWRPQLLVDDGSHLIRLAHSERPEALSGLRGSSEETTSGVRPLHEMAAAGELRLPVIAVNDARTKTDFDNRVGTGQSCVLAVADLLDPDDAPPLVLERPLVPVAGTSWTVVGYGPVGEGVARFAAALGARVTVVERDAVRALSAVHDGFAAAPLAEACASADVVISATGVWHTLDGAVLAALRPGTAVAVAGGIDDELGLDELGAAGWMARELAPGIAEWSEPGSEATEHGILVLADGGGVNYTAGEGNPIEVMDLSFATQLAALDRLARAELEPGVHAIETADELRVAAAALAARGDGADPAPVGARPGGAAQPWRVHRYRSAG
ncbi:MULTISPECIES: adenosylhomocysteinase [unclassified Leucobacter]|uniref:adenosylhomocysteinase n=1 Tax=unclassified Leucobacter TaxID=2621730 RepID=UPI000A5F6A53|nr:adenosylhomocysteinase [Leucobacter sp. Ag1]